jgi:hypothetical protein
MKSGCFDDLFDLVGTELYTIDNLFVDDYYAWMEFLSLVISQTWITKRIMSTFMTMEGYFYSEPCLT